MRKRKSIKQRTKTKKDISVGLSESDKKEIIDAIQLTVPKVFKTVIDKVDNIEHNQIEIRSILFGVNGTVGIVKQLSDAIKTLEGAVQIVDRLSQKVEGTENEPGLVKRMDRQEAFRWKLIGIAIALSSLASIVAELLIRAKFY